MASGQSRPATRTASRCTMQKARGTHAFEIHDYSLQRQCFGKGKFICSAAFYVGDYRWCIKCYPDGDGTEGSRGCISVYLMLLTKNVEVQALMDLRLLDQKTGLSCSGFNDSRSVVVFSTMNANQNRNQKKGSSLGRDGFIKRSTLESSPYLQGDRFVIECDVTVIKETCVSLDGQKVQVPPSELSRNFGELLETEEGFDVTFSVEGQIFRAHRIVLAVRSPVFKAELYGPLGKDNSEFITIGDMQPVIFKALLHFIYTDSMPPMEDHDKDEKIDFVKHLLMVADRYAVDRLKLICEEILCKHVDVDSVATMLVLADQLNCRNLKDACFKNMGYSNAADNSVASKESLKSKRSWVCCLFRKLFFFLKQ